MNDPPPILDYSVGTPEPIRRAQRLRILSIIAIACSLLTTFLVGRIELLNTLAGSPLPFAPLPPDARHNWRDRTSSEGHWRVTHLNPATDPTWNTRPLTVAERADYERFRSQVHAYSDLRGAVKLACWVDLMVLALLVGLPILIWKHRSIRWRLTLALALVLQLLTAIALYRLDFGEAVSRAFE